MNVLIKNDQSEIVRYNVPDFPVYLHRDILSEYPGYAAPSHWHDDLEFVCVLSGHMQYNINGQIINLQENEGVWVNTRQFHYGFSDTYEECIFICLLAHPLLLCSSSHVEQNFVMPVLQNEGIPYLHLHPHIPCEKEILEIIREIYQAGESDDFPLQMESLFFKLWRNLYQLSGHTKEKNTPRNQHLSILKDMIRFIYNNYTEKISLADISQAGKVGKTTCCHIFQEYTNETPMAYLTDYRLKKSLELLKNTDKTISEICFDVGFSGASYYTETFRKAYGYTPKDYRKRLP